MATREPSETCPVVEPATTRAHSARPSLRVVPIAQYRARDTVTVLTHLLALAQNGKLHGLVLTALHTDGGEDIVFTGAYRRQLRLASAAAGRMYWRSMQLQDEEDDA